MKKIEISVLRPPHRG